MREHSTFIRSYPAVLLGLVVFLAGSAGVGITLGLAGEGVQTAATTTAVISGIGLAAGLGFLVVVFRQRGGLLRGPHTDAERRRYRWRYRRGAREPDTDFSRTKRV